MNAGKPARLDRAERVVRGMLAVVLIAAVVWALAEGGAAPNLDFRFSSLRG